MRRLLIGGMVLGFLIATGTANAVRADDPPWRQPTSQSWLSKLLGGSSPATKPAKKDKPKKFNEATREEKDENFNVAVPTRVPAGSRSAEEAAYWRRLEVCDQLRTIAVQNNDEALIRLVDQLELRAFDVYNQRTGNAPLGGVGDAELLERHSVNTPSGSRRGSDQANVVPGKGERNR